MRESTFYNWLLIAWSAAAVGIFVFLFFFNAPYGRHARRNWGPVLSDKLGWILMECPSPVLFAACFLVGRKPGIMEWVFFAAWEAHYLHRAFIYPFTIRGSERRMSLAVIISGFVFNAVNAYLNGRWLFFLSAGYETAFAATPAFVIGLSLFAAGYAVNRHSDTILRNLRKSGESGYSIPYGGLYRYVSSPNYLGEIVEWIGWALLTRSSAGLCFAAWTAANLVPRSRANHAWYRARFPEYPPDRKALVPFIW
jgi:3-oxo-5-alpha-steroid 4-dehydrogenase 1